MSYFSTPHPEDRHYTKHYLLVSEEELIEKMRSSGTPQGLVPHILEQIQKGSTVTVGGRVYLWRD